MAKIIFFEPGVVMGLWLGIVFAVFAIVVVNLKSFELSLKQYRFWRTMISQAVPLCWLFSFVLWTVFYCIEIKLNAYAAIGINAVLAVAAWRFFVWFRRRELRRVEDVLVCMNNMIFLLLVVETLLLLIGAGLYAAASLVGTQFVFWGVSVVLLKSLRMHLLSKNEVYAFKVIRSDENEGIYGIIRLDDNTCFRVKLRGRSVSGYPLNLTGRELMVRVFSFHPFRVVECVSCAVREHK